MKPKWSIYIGVINRDSAVVLQKHKYEICPNVTQQFPLPIVSGRVHKEYFSCTEYQNGSWKYLFSSFIITLDRFTPLHLSWVHKGRKWAEGKLLANVVPDRKWAFQRSLTSCKNEQIREWTHSDSSSESLSANTPLDPVTRWRKQMFGNKGDKIGSYRH